MAGRSLHFRPERYYDRARLRALIGRFGRFLAVSFLAGGTSELRKFFLNNTWYRCPFLSIPYPKALLGHHSRLWPKHLRPKHFLLVGRLN